MSLNRQKCEKRYMILMKISNKVLSEMVFFFFTVGYDTTQDVKICRKKMHFYMLRWQNVKKKKKKKKKKKRNKFKEIIFYILRC